MRRSIESADALIDMSREAVLESRYGAFSFHRAATARAASQSGRARRRGCSERCRRSSELRQAACALYSAGHNSAMGVRLARSQRPGLAPAASGEAPGARAGASGALPAVSLSEPFENGLALLRAAEERGLEGIVSKRRDAPYRSGECNDWLKVKPVAWREANRERMRLFEKTRPVFKRGSGHQPEV
jgi:hypothetical protein